MRRCVALFSALASGALFLSLVHAASNEAHENNDLVHANAGDVSRNDAQSNYPSTGNVHASQVEQHGEMSEASPGEAAVGDVEEPFVEREYAGNEGESSVDEDDNTSQASADHFARDDEDDVGPSWHEVLEDFVADGEDLITVEQDSVAALRMFRRAAVLGHTGAMATVGALLSSGDVGLPRDLSNGVKFLRMGADRGQPDAQASLAFLYASGLADRYGVEKSEAKAILYWTLAAEGGSVFAQVAMGYRMFFGVGLSRNCHSASRFYRAAARSIANDPRHMPSIENFFSRRPPLPSTLTKGTSARDRLSEEQLGQSSSSAPSSADDEVLEYNRHKAAHGNGDSLTALAGLHLYGGQGVQIDEAAAVRYLRRAADDGHGEAHGILAHLALNRNDNATALKHFELSAAANAGMGLYGLGMMYLHGVAVEKDPAKAASLFINATELQHADATYQVGMLYLRGDGVERNAAEAYRYFQHGARLGQIQAKMNLAIMTLEAQYPVSTPDCERGVRLLKDVAEGGEWDTLMSLAVDELNEGNIYSALYRFSQAAQAGIEVAQYNAALIMEVSAKVLRGGTRKERAPGVLFEPVSYSVPKHPLGQSEELQHWSAERLMREALNLYDLSFEQGHSESVVRAGHLAYAEMKDYKLAASAYEKGAQSRNSECSVSLGYLYFRGLGVVANRFKTVEYLEKARLDSSEGAIPAAIALLLVRVAWWVTDRLLKGKGADVVRDHLRNMLILQDDRSSNDAGFSSDFVLLSALASLLVVVVLARRRRIKREQAHQEADGIDDDSGLGEDVQREYGHVYEE